jgi:hypothetical protein
MAPDHAHRGFSKAVGVAFEAVKVDGFGGVIE